jgi:hypothetical protein
MTSFTNDQSIGVFHIVHLGSGITYHLSHTASDLVGNDIDWMKEGLKMPYDQQFIYLNHIGNWSNSNIFPVLGVNSQQVLTERMTRYEHLGVALYSTPLPIRLSATAFTWSVYAFSYTQEFLIANMDDFWDGTTKRKVQIFDNFMMNLD